MVFEATTARVKKEVLKAGANQEIVQLADYPAYQKVIVDSFLSSNPLVFGVVHINILEELINDVEKNGHLDEAIYHAMELIFRALAHLEFGDILEERRQNVEHHFLKIKNDSPPR